MRACTPCLLTPTHSTYGCDGLPPHSLLAAVPDPVTQSRAFAVDRQGRLVALALRSPSLPLPVKVRTVLNNCKVNRQVNEKSTKSQPGATSLCVWLKKNNQPCLCTHLCIILVFAPRVSMSVMRAGAACRATPPPPPIPGANPACRPEWPLARCQRQRGGRVQHVSPPRPCNVQNGAAVDQARTGDDCRQRHGRATRRAGGAYSTCKHAG